MEDNVAKPRPPSLIKVRLKNYLIIGLFTLPFFALSIGLLVVATSPQAALGENWKEVFLVFGTGIITFTSAYLGASFENQRERERELRQIRRTRVIEYREYLIGLWKLAQRTELAAELTGIGYAQAQRNAGPDDARLDEMLEKLPLYGPFSVIDKPECRLAVDNAINMGLSYWLEDNGNRPPLEEMKHSLIIAIRHLDIYETQT